MSLNSASRTTIPRAVSSASHRNQSYGTRSWSPCTRSYKNARAGRASTASYASRSADSGFNYR